MPRSIGRRIRGIAAVSLLLCLTAASVQTVAADPRSRLEEIRDRQAELQEKIDAAIARRGEILARIEIVDSERAGVEAVIDELDMDLARLSARIRVVTDRLTRTQQELALLHAELEDVLGRLVSRTDVFTERAVAAYKAGPTAYLDGLFSAESFGDLVERYSYYQAVLEADGELIEEIEVLRAETEQKRAQVERQEARIVADKQSLESDRARVAAIRAEKASALAGLKAALRTKRGLLAEVEGKRRHFENVQAQLERESDQIQNLLAGPSETRYYGGGTFAWPAPGPVTSGYGYRTHPIFGDTRLHTGIDIGAPYGATVVAAERGTVVYAGVMSGYGNVIVVDHGGGIATTYNHLSAFFVSTGRTVSRASSIGAVGCTGYCTGPHLHFEVRVDGNPVDPMPYLR